MPSDAALLNSTASALEQVSTRVKAGDIRTRAKSSARPSRPQLNVAELVRRWDKDAFSGGGTFDRDGWEDVESRRVAEQNRVLRERQRKLEEQRGRGTRSPSPNGPRPPRMKRHAACALFFDVVPTEIRIEPRPRAAATARATATRLGKPAVSAVTLAVGVRAGHGYQADEASLAEMVPDPDERDQIMGVAARVMEHPEFCRLRDALRTRLQFRDVLYRDEIARIARSVTGLPDAGHPSSAGGLDGRSSRRSYP